MTKLNFFWHRRDLRIEDNAGLYKALKSDYPVQPIFIFDENILSHLEVKDDARITFIHNEISRLTKEYKSHGANLIVRYGEPLEVWKELLSEYSINTVFTNRDYEPYAKSRDAQVYDLLNKSGVEFIGAKDHVIFEKNEVVKGDGSPYLVFSPYAAKWRQTLNDFYASSYPTENYLDGLHTSDSEKAPSLEDLGFIKSDIEFPSKSFPEDIIHTYNETRDYPAQNGTTRLSVHLRFGTISIRKLLRTALSSNQTYVNELIWRDFYQMILFHYPDCPEKAIKPQYDRIDWESNQEHFDKWCRGETGYPMVDAGMRELNETGYMHNRVRMVVASFLTKHLLLDWRLGERYFAEKLLDYDLASNVGGWQWASGSGCDAAPYFRIFNPTSQLEKFDPELKYVKRWLPEYGTSAYVKPMVDHKWARERALERYKAGLKD